MKIENKTKIRQVIDDLNFQFETVENGHLKRRNYSYEELENYVKQQAEKAIELSDKLHEVLMNENIDN